MNKIKKTKLNKKKNNIKKSNKISIIKKILFKGGNYLNESQLDFELEDENENENYENNNNFYLSETDEDSDLDLHNENDNSLKERDIYVTREKLFEPIGILDPYGVNDNPVTNMPYKNIFYDPCIKKGVKIKYPKYNNEEFENYTYQDVAILGIKGDGKGWYALPMHESKEKIIELFYDNQVSLLICGTGVGKTVLAPKYAMHVLNYKGKISITNPKQKPNDNNSHYSSQCLDIELGSEISRQYQGSSANLKPTEKTLLNYMTDGSLMNDFINDPDLNKYDCIIMDEVHERNENIDKLLLLCKELCYRRPKFKLILLSATVNPVIFRNYFKVDNIKYGELEITGLANFKNEEYFADDTVLQSLNIEPAIILNSKNDFKINNQYHLKPAAKIIIHILKTYPNDKRTILFFIHGKGAFKTGKPELEKELKMHFPNTYQRIKIGIVTGSGSAGTQKEKDQQTLLLATTFPNNEYDRCIIFGTEVVESSITIENLGFVIDSGLSNKVYYKYNTDENINELSPIAKSSHKQRAGRVGRTSSGYVFNLFTKEAYDKFDDYTIAGIHKNNSSDFIVQSLGLQNIVTHIEFPFTYNNPTPKSLNEYIGKLIEPLDSNNVSFLLQKFYALQLFNIKGNYGFLNDLGIAVSKIKLQISNICIKKMIILSIIYNCVKEISRLICFLCLSDKIDISQIISYNNSIKYLNEKNPEDLKKMKELEEKFKKTIKKFNSPYGDFMSILNILNAYFDKKNGISDPITDRIISEPWLKQDLEEWCKEHFLIKRNLDNLQSVKSDIKEEKEEEKEEKKQNITITQIRREINDIKLFFKNKYPGLTIQQVFKPYKLIDTNDKTTNILITIIDSFFCNIVRNNTLSSNSNSYYTFLYKKSPEINYIYEIEYKNLDKIKKIKLNDNLFKDDTHLYLWLENHFNWDKSNIKIINKEPIYKEENNFTKANLQDSFDRKSKEIKCFYSLNKKKDTYLVYNTISSSSFGTNLDMVTAIPDNIISLLKECSFGNNLNERIFTKSLDIPPERKKKLTIKNKKNYQTHNDKKKKTHQTKAIKKIITS